MNRRLLVFTVMLTLAYWTLNAQPPQSRPQMGITDGGITDGIDMKRTERSFVLNVNSMNNEKREKLNQVASNYRRRNRSAFTDMSKAMLSGGVTAILNVLGTEAVNLIKIRSNQKKAWKEMRQKECTFVDSLQSVRGQCDFYARQSEYGPLDPTNMNFDGITLLANRNGEEVLRMVCHIDTARLDHLFLHSKFYLVVDTIVFHPFRSFLPNLEANRIHRPRKGEVAQDVIDYWNTISQFSFDEYGEPAINIKMEITSSWINELVQVYQDVKLGSFAVKIPIKESGLTDSVYFYSRERALAMHQPLINMEGDCFVVPRSYMPVSANNPSWGTGEYKMKVVMSETCRYNPEAGRSTNWHRDYKQLVRMQNHGKARNEYVDQIITTFRDNSSTILKATYTPALTALPGMLGITTQSGGMGGAKGAMGAAAKGAQGAAIPGATNNGNPYPADGGNKQGGRPQGK